MLPMLKEIMKFTDADKVKAAFASLQPRLFGSWDRALHGAGLDAEEVSRYRKWDADTVVFNQNLELGSLAPAAHADGPMNEQERAAILLQAKQAGIDAVFGPEMTEPRPLAEIVAGVTEPSQSSGKKPSSSGSPRSLPRSAPPR